MTLTITGDIVKDVELVTSSISLVVALISIVIGILIIIRCAGKLKAAAIFLVLSIGLFAIHSILVILDINGVIGGKSFLDILNTIIIIFILIALILMKKMISTISDQYNIPSKKRST